MSPALVATVITAEDRRFREHGGVDWAAFLGAAWDNLVGGRRRGASTITMQLAAALDDDLRASAGRRSFAQKWRQARAARELGEESLLLAALLRAPNAAPSTVARRACVLARARLERLAALHVRVKPRIRARLDAAPHLAAVMIRRGGSAPAWTPRRTWPR